MSEPVDCILVRSDESTDRSKALTEGTHDKVYFISQSEMVTDASSISAEYSDSMCFIYHDTGIVFVFQTDNFWQRSQITFHGEDTIYNNQFNGIGIAFLELFLQIFHVIVLVLELAGERQSTAVNNRGVVTFITDDIVFPSCNGSDNS